MNFPFGVYLLALSSLFSFAHAAELSEQDIMQCHQFSGLAANYQSKKQAGISIEEAIKNSATPAEVNLAKQIYDAFDSGYSPALIRRQLFDECAKSFAAVRENERTS
jgi:hypothetical protein